MALKTLSPNTLGRVRDPRSICQATVHQSIRRRELLQIGIALPLAAFGRPARADVVDTHEVVPQSVSDAATPGTVAFSEVEVPDPTSLAAMTQEPYLDLEFQLAPPPGFIFVDTQPPYDPDRRGPAPPPSPVKARFDSPDGSCVLSVIVQNAQTIQRSILQTTDVSVFGSLEEAAKLLLPRGSRVIAGSALQVVLPPRQTALGPVEVPPKNYYRYEFTTTNGLHVVMTAAAMKGKVFVCGGSTSAGASWERYGAALRAATESFRLREGGMVL